MKSVGKKNTTTEKVEMNISHHLVNRINTMFRNYTSSNKIKVNAIRREDFLSFGNHVSSWLVTGEQEARGKAAHWKIGRLDGAEEMRSWIS